MRLIGDFLKKFEVILPPNQKLKEAVNSALKETIGMSIKEEKITVSGKSIYLDISPAFKNKIFIKKEKIEEIINQKLNKKTKYSLR